MKKWVQTTVQSLVYGHQHLMVLIVEQNLVGISVFMLVVFLGIHMTRRIGQLYENLTSSTKPEVHNVSQRCKRRTEPQPQATCIKVTSHRASRDCGLCIALCARDTQSNCPIFIIDSAEWFPCLCERTNRLTDILITIDRSSHPLRGEVMTYFSVECNVHNPNSVNRTVCKHPTGVVTKNIISDHCCRRLYVICRT